MAPRPPASRRRASAPARARRAAPRDRPRRSECHATRRASRACGLIDCAASTPRHADFAGSGRMRSGSGTAARPRRSSPTRLISTATQPSSCRGTSGRRGRSPSATPAARAAAPRRGIRGCAASSSCRSRSTPSFSSAAASPMSCSTSRSISCDPDLELVLGLALPACVTTSSSTVLDSITRRRRHPVQRLVAARVGVDEQRAVVLEHQEPHRLRQVRRSGGRCRRPRSGRR